MTAGERPLGAPVAFAGAPAPERRVHEGRHVRLEPLDPSLHGAELWRAASAADAAATFTYLPDGPFADEAALRDLLATRAARADPLFLAIRPRDGPALGWASFMRIVPAMGVIEIGHIWLAPPLQRTTAATEALFLMMAHAMDDLGYRRLEWKCDALNAASRAAASRLGFSFEGIFRQHLIVKGRNRDTAWFAIVDRDWPAVRAAFAAWLDPANFDAAGRQLSPLAARREIGR